MAKAVACKQCLGSPASGRPPRPHRGRRLESLAAAPIGESGCRRPGPVPPHRASQARRRLRGTLSVALSRAALPVCLPTLSTRRLARTNLRSRQGLALTHFQACFAPLSTSTLRRPSCHWTAAVPTTRSRALRFCASCTPSPLHSSRSCASGMDNSPHTSGGTPMGSGVRSIRAKGANKGTPWHRRAREALDVVTSSIETRAGVTANLGKTRVPASPGIAELGANVWRGDAPEAERGFVALGTPLRHPGFVAAHTDTRLLEEARLLQELPLPPDLQCAWLLLAMCASPRADHLLRTLPPDLSASYARGHDDAVWRCLLALLGAEDDADPEVAARCCLLVREASACSVPREPPLQLTGPPGPTHCLCCARAAPTPPPGASPSSLQVRLLLPPVWLLPLRRAACWMLLDGKAALLGTMYITVFAPRNATCLNLARGAKVGSITVPAPALPTFARPSCYLPCRPLPRPCCVRSPGRTQPRGLVPSRARLAPLCRPTAC